MCVRRYKDEVFKECVFPKLDSPYKEALEDAVKFILKKFSVQGIIVTGSIISGTHSKSSDLDIFAINNRYERQRIQKYFNKIPCEIFISTSTIIKEEISEGTTSGNCTTAHMFSSGFTIYDQNHLVYKLKNKSKDLIARGPSNSKIIMQSLKYRVADSYENAMDIKDSDPYMSIIILSNTIVEAVNYKLRELGKWEPKHKDLLKELEKNDMNLFNLIKKFHEIDNFDDKFKISQEIIDNTIKVNGFFEWESEIEIHKD